MTYLDNGFDKNLFRAVTTPASDQFTGSGLDISGYASDTSGTAAASTDTSSVTNPITQSTDPTNVVSGSLDQIIFSKKTSFTDPTEGWMQGIDKTGTYKWIIGGATNSIDWNVTTANVLTVKGSVVANSGTIGTWYINATTLSSSGTAATSGILLDATNQQIRVGSSAANYILLDGPNLRIRSSNYVAGVSGFTIEPTLIEAENIVARGTLRGVSFKYDVISAVGGQLLVSNSDALALDMTALDASTLTTRGDTTFAVNDILHIKAVTASGIQEEWLRVTNIGSAPTYTVTRDLAAAYAANSNPIWKAGTAVVKEGISDGGASYSGGWLRLLGQGTNSPYYSVYARTGVAYNASTEAVRLGNLNGIGSFVADTYGIFIGNSATGNYAQYDTLSGNFVVNDSSLSNQDIYGDGSDGDVVISGDTTLSSDMFYNSLTVNTTKNLDCGGFRVFVKTITTNNGTVHANGSIGGDATNAAGSSSKGTKGTGGGARSDGSLKGALAGQNGVDGVNGVSHFGAGGSAAGNTGVDGNAGVNVVKSLDTSNGLTGKTAGNCGLGNGIAGGTPGNGQGGGTITGTVLNKIKNFQAAYLLTEFLPSGTVQIITTAPSNGSSGSGGSGSSQASAGESATSGGTGGTGGNGGNGGICWISSRKIINNGTISANGGAAGVTGTTANSTVSGGNSGSGGSGGSAGAMGGNGGAVILTYGTLVNTGTIQSIGGAGSVGKNGGNGANSGTGTSSNGTKGTDGVSGNNGVSILLKV